MKQIDARLNRSTLAQSSERKGLEPPGPVQRVDLDATLRLLPPTVPEDRELSEAAGKENEAAIQEAALTAYLERHAFLMGGGKLSAGHANKRAGGWNYG